MELEIRMVDFDHVDARCERTFSGGSGSRLVASAGRFVA